MTDNKEARIEISTICNYKCNFCPLNNNSFSRQHTTMSMYLFNKIIEKLRNEANQLTDVTLSGMGEPTVDPDLLDKIEVLNNSGYRVRLLTNGSLLNEKIIRKFYEEKHRLESIRFSFHSIDRDVYKKLTGATNFHYDLVVDNIENAIENRKRSEKPKIIITSDLPTEHETCVDELVNYFRDRVDLIEVWKPHNWVDWKNYRKHSDKKLKTCGRPFYGPLQIQVDGTVNMCCFDFNGDLIIGDLKTQTIDEIFKSESYKRIKEAHKDQNLMDMTDLICKNCDQRNPKDSSVVIYNSKYDSIDRVHRLSTTYEKVKERF